jgi:hypothetical protein
MIDTPASRATSLNVARAGFLRVGSDSRYPFIDDSLPVPSRDPFMQLKRHSLIYLLRAGLRKHSVFQYLGVWPIAKPFASNIARE